MYGIFLSIFDALAILTFGEGIFSTSTYPLNRLVKVISIADFLENLDALGILYFMGTAFFKVTVQLYGVIQGIKQLLYLRNSRGLILPIACIVFYLAMTESRNLSEHRFTGITSLGYPGIVPYIVIPILLLIVIFIRNQQTSKKGG